MTDTRTYCRNPRCRSKLKTPVEAKRQAFCCRRCYDGYYRLRCVVCEEPRKPHAGKLCGRRKCRNEFRRTPDLFTSPWEKPKTPFPNLPTVDVNEPSKRQAKSNGFWRDKTGRAWRWIEAPERIDLLDRDGRLAARLVEDDRGWLILKPWATPPRACLPLEQAKAQALTLALSALSLDKVTADRLRHANRGALAAPHRFEIAPDVPPPTPPTPAKIAGDGLDIPEFLWRSPHAVALQEAAE